MPRKVDAPKTREYVTHDPHTVALAKQDALERLEKWLMADPKRWVGDFDRSRRGKWAILLYEAGSDWAVIGRGVTLAYAIHAALDQAEAKR